MALEMMHISTQRGTKSRIQPASPTQLSVSPQSSSHQQHRQHVEILDQAGFSLSHLLPLLTQQDVVRRRCLANGFGLSTLDGADGEECLDRVSTLDLESQYAVKFLLTHISKPARNMIKATQYEPSLLTFDGHHEGEHLHNSGLSDIFPTRRLCPDSLTAVAGEKRKCEAVPAEPQPQASKTCSCTIQICPRVPTNPSAPPPPNNVELKDGHFPQRFGFYKHKQRNVVMGDRTGKDLYSVAEVDFTSGLDSWIRLRSGVYDGPVLALVMWPQYTLNHLSVDMRPLVPTDREIKQSFAKAPRSRQSGMYVLFKDYWPSGYHETLEETKDARCFKFGAFVPETSKRESFQWENCIVQGIEGLEDGFGRRLIRLETQEIVAGWTRPKGWKPMKPKHGMMVFLGCWKSLGQDFQILAVISTLVSIKAHRDMCGARCADGYGKCPNFKGRAWPSTD